MHGAKTGKHRDLSPAGDSFVREASVPLQGTSAEFAALDPRGLPGEKKAWRFSRPPPGTSILFTQLSWPPAAGDPGRAFSCRSSGSVVDFRHRLDFFGLIDELVREIAGRA